MAPLSNTTKIIICEHEMYNDLIELLIIAPNKKDMLCLL